MKIDNTNSNTNFKAFYRLNYSGANKAQIDKDLPMLLSLGFPLSAYVGQNPLAKTFMKIFKFLADGNSASVNWLKLNAKNYNLDVNIDELNTITFVTGHKDKIEFDKIDSKLRLKIALNLFKERIKMLFGIFYYTGKQNEPAHIKSLKIVNKFFIETQNEYDKFLADKNVKDLSSYDEFKSVFANEFLLNILQKYFNT